MFHCKGAANNLQDQLLNTPNEYRLIEDAEMMVEMRLDFLRAKHINTTPKYNVDLRSSPMLQEITAEEFLRVYIIDESARAVANLRKIEEEQGEQE